MLFSFLSWTWFQCYLWA